MLQVPFSWTDSNVAILKRDWPLGKMAADIARELGISRKAVIGKANRLGLGVHPTRARDPNWKPRRVRRAERQRERELMRTLTGSDFRRAKSKPLPPVVSVNPLNLAFLDLRDGQCRYAVTENSPYLFCGHPVQEKSSYCPCHHRVCWTPYKRTSA